MCEHDLTGRRYIPSDHSATHYAPFDHASQNTFQPQASRDSALTSFAQLGAIRLGTERGLISLFDKTHQHVLAEATPTLSLFGGGVRDDRERLLLGCCVLPKERGFCRHVERLPSSEYTAHDEIVGEDSLVVLDVKENERIHPPNLLDALSEVRFYAAVPIVSPRGFTIGAYSVMDTQPRTTTLDQNHLQFMKNMATTVMEHLTMGHATQKNRQAERMIVGLGSFVEGRSTLRDSWREANAQYAASEQSGGSTEGQLNIQQQNLQQEAKDIAEKKLAFRDPPRNPPNEARSRSHTREQGTKYTQPPRTDPHKHGNSVRSVLAGESLRDDTMATSVKQIFSRAANLIRESIGAEGVMFLDANSERFGSLVKSNSRKVTGPASKEPASSSDESTDSASSKQNASDGESESTLMSECLGFSSSRVSSIDDETRAGQGVVVPEPLFSSLIRRYPRGKIFSFNADGSVSEDSGSSQHQSEYHSKGNTGDFRTDEQRAARKRRRKPTFQQDASNLMKIFAHARNILLLPLWDSNKQRWFAGTLVWTNDPEHIFTSENELVYISAFANSIMAEIRRVDVEFAEKAKTNLVSSITHELRNPLHGILGTADILSDTAMNALQHGMVHTIESCGRTLLDTINNLLDLTFIDKYQKKVPRSQRKRAEKQNSKAADSKDLTKTQKKERGEDLSSAHVELDAVLEEVAECVFAGYSFYTNPKAPPPALNDSSSRWAGPTSQSDAVGPRASQVTIIFDIQPDTEWHFNTHAGAWRRILMNVFGNALKYTPSGYIYLGLSSSQRDTTSKKREERHENEFEVTLTVKDTGKGIGPQYLHDGLFTPFSQENPLASGSGLGLSIVRQAVGFLGGSIEIESTQGVGTTLTIRTPLNPACQPSDTSSSSAMFSSLQKYTEGKTVGFLGFGETLQSQRDTSLYSSLERLCNDWFGLKTQKVSPTEGEHQVYDFYLAVQTELDSENTEGRNLFGLSQHLNTNDRCSPVVVICQSPEEAHKLFVSAKNRNDETFYFEFISQPCGPRKLARAFDICIQRQGGDQHSRPSTEEPTHWVEMPQSTHLPVDLGPSDPPQDRMKIRKRPTADTMGSPDRGDRVHTFNEANPLENQQDVPNTPKEVDRPKTTESSVLLVDDNELNLQLLCAYTTKDGHQYMTAKNGADAVDLYKTHLGKFRVVIIGKYAR
jgi:signal transduction histidine kinase